MVLVLRYYQVVQVSSCQQYLAQWYLALFNRRNTVFILGEIFFLSKSTFYSLILFTLIINLLSFAFQDQQLYLLQFKVSNLFLAAQVIFIVLQYFLIYINIDFQLEKVYLLKLFKYIYSILRPYLIQLQALFISIFNIQRILSIKVLKYYIFFQKIPQIFIFYILKFSYFLIGNPLLLNRVRSFILCFFLQSLVKRGQLIIVFLLVIVWVNIVI